MAVVFFDSFDLNYDIGRQSGYAGENVYGILDHNRYWHLSSQPYQFPYTEGYGGGQALRIGTPYSPYGQSSLSTTGVLNSRLPSNGVIRLGFKFKGSPTATEGRIVGVGYGTGSTDLVLQLAAGNLLKLYYDIGSGLVLADTFNVLDAPLWNVVEVFFNRPTGAFSVKVNNTTATGTVPATSNTRCDIGWGSSALFSTSYPVFDIDDVWITDGTPLVDGVNAVQISGTWDNYERFISAGFRGSMVFGDNRYVTPWEASGIATQNMTSTFDYLKDKNLSNNVKFTYGTNPNTGLPWTNSDLSFQWGLCYGGDGSKIRLTGLCLEILEVVDGVPRITIQRPTNEAFFSGPWEKTDQDISFAAHINSLPRQAGQDISDVRSLYISGEGCILFNTTGADPGVDPFPYVGLTFAEKNAVNHRDWTKVDGVGERAEAYFVSGYGVYGESNKKFQSNYVSVNYETALGGQAYIQGVWDYSVNPDTGRWSMRQQVYGPKTVQDFKHGTRKLKIRGHGKAIQLKVTSFQDAPFILNGWAVFVTSNTAV